MKDIAKRCGVSIATVSKALNGQQDISEQTRVRIRSVADEMGYLTNSAARALKTNRTYNIGVLFVDGQSIGLAHEYFSSVLDSLRAEAERSGYDITFISGTVGEKPTGYLQHCLYRGVDGVVIASVDFYDSRVQELVQADLPVVIIDHVFNNRICVVSDNVSGMEALVHYAAERGHRRLAFIHGERTAVTENRLTGFYRACEELKIPVPEDWVIESRFHDPDRCYEATKKLLEQPERPSCIFFPDDFSYLGGMNALHEAGLRVPEDISVIGYDGIHLSQVISPRLTTWRQDTGELGRIAVSRLVELIEHPRTTVLDRIIVPGRLIPGESVAQQ